MFGERSQRISVYTHDDACGAGHAAPEWVAPHPSAKDAYGWGTRFFVVGTERRNYGGPPAYGVLAAEQSIGKRLSGTNPKANERTSNAIQVVHAKASKVSPNLDNPCDTTVVKDNQVLVSGPLPLIWFT